MKVVATQCCRHHSGRRSRCCLFTGFYYSTNRAAAYCRAGRRRGLRILHYWGCVSFYRAPAIAALASSLFLWAIGLRAFCLERNDARRATRFRWYDAEWRWQESVLAWLEIFAGTWSAAWFNPTRNCLLSGSEWAWPAVTALLSAVLPSRKTNAASWPSRYWHISLALWGAADGRGTIRNLG